MKWKGNIGFDELWIAFTREMIVNDRYVVIHDAQGDEVGVGRGAGDEEVVEVVEVGYGYSCKPRWVLRVEKTVLSH